jgi:hypothetical protein
MTSEAGDLWKDHSLCLSPDVFSYSAFGTSRGTSPRRRSSCRNRCLRASHQPRSRRSPWTKRRREADGSRECRKHAKGIVRLAVFTSELAEDLSADVLDRLLRYVRIDTQSDRVSGWAVA